MFALLHVYISLNAEILIHNINIFPQFYGYIDILISQQVNLVTLGSRLER
jgi:hypothetical protein